MSKKIVTVSDLKYYMVQMLRTGRAGDTYPRILHAPNIGTEIVLTVVGNLVMTADDNSIEVGTRRTKGGILHEINQVWFTVQGRPYVIVYHKGQIEIRSRTKHGPSVHAINKATPPAHATTIFASL